MNQPERPASAAGARGYLISDSWAHSGSALLGQPGYQALNTESYFGDRRTAKKRLGLSH
jgi:hypothetical protein